MWIAEKIELIKFGSSESKSFFKDCDILKINGVVISDSVKDKISIAWQALGNEFPARLCHCGCEGTDIGEMLAIVKHKKSVLIIPAFAWLDYEEDILDPLTETCIIPLSEEPPQYWFEHGVLCIEGAQLTKLYELLHFLIEEEIPEIDTYLLSRVIEWEALVKKKPKGFEANDY